MTNILKKFNLSYSALNTYKQSQLQFYFQYIEKAGKTDEINQSYGKAGNIMHNAIAVYIDGLSEEVANSYFHKGWDGEKLISFKGLPLDKDKYLGLLKKAMEIVDKYGVENLLDAEKRFEFMHNGILIKGFIDLIVHDTRETFIIDWKSDSQSTHDKHLLQRQFYNWVLWRNIGTMRSHAIWHYLAQDKTHEDILTAEDAQKFEDEVINPFIKEIQEKGFDKKNYELGEYRQPFNAYKTACEGELLRRGEEDKHLRYKITIKGIACYLSGDIDGTLLMGLDHKFKFDLPDKHFMQEAAKKRGKGVIDLRDIGTMHMFSVSRKAFNIGHLEKVQEIIHEYGVYKKCKTEVEIVDKRDKEIMNKSLGIMPNKLNTDKVFRDYQNDAKNIFIELESGILEIAARGGKTLIAAECIRQIDGTTIWLIDRIRLLKQTKKVLQDLLGIKIGEISGNMIDIDGCSVIIASVQTLKTRLPEFMNLLYKINFVVIDEFHKSAALSYQKIFSKLPNTKYKLGITATARRTDGKEPILFSIIGKIIYKISSKQLADLGFLVQPKIKFYNINKYDSSLKTYRDDYIINIVENSERNNKIVQVVNENKELKIMILTKQVNHGRELTKKIIGAKHVYGSLLKKNTPIFEDFLNNKFKCLVITQSKGSEGLDIPDLDMVINAAGNKSNIATEQSGSRSLTMIKGKNTGYIIDFVDGGKYTKKHSRERIETYGNMGFEVEVI